MHRRAALPIVRNGLARRRFISRRVRDATATFSFFFFLSSLTTMDGPRSYADGESSEGHDEDGEAKHEPEVHAPEGDVSYFFAWASLYFLASSTQHSRPSFFVARCAVSTATPRLDGIATGRARTGTGSSGLARAAREARAWTRPRGGAAARTDTAMASIARVLVSKIRDVTMMSWHLGRNATSFGAIAGNGKRTRRGGQLVYNTRKRRGVATGRLIERPPLTLFLNSRRRLTKRALRRTSSYRAACAYDAAYVSRETSSQRVLDDLVHGLAHRHLAGVDDDDFLLGRRPVQRLDGAHDVHAAGDLAEHDVASVEPGGLDGADEELRAVGVRAGVAMESVSGPWCLSLKFSSSNFSP